ncbi:MAG: hypothetical protein ACFFEF_16205 [Candidatus Thorarchaeota archaeon]
MQRKLVAILLVLIIAAGTGAGLLYLYSLPQSPVIVDNPSEFRGTAWISEVYYASSLEVSEEFFEVYVDDSYEDSIIEHWSITTFDDEGIISLPTITGIDGFDYIAIFTGSGVPDLDASDGNATVYLNQTERILDPSGDEIGIFDVSFEVVDFMRYNGGNGDDLYDNWPAADLGPANIDGSISLFGVDTGTSENWLDSIATPASPNIHVFTTSGTGYLVEIQSGVNQEYSFLGIDDYIAGKNETVDITPGPGVSAATVEKVKEHIEFSLNFYDGKGFDRGPAAAAGNKIKITLKNGTTTESVGKASPKGDITIEIGTIPSDIDLKYVAEHELMHLFQFKTEKEGTDTVDHAPVANKWWIEGQATYWGIESTKANYNLTNQEIQDEFDRVGDHNWYDHYTDLNRSIFIGWGGSYSDYMGSYLFMKFIREKYGEDKLKDAFDKAKDNFNNDSKDVSPEDAIAEACGKTWDQLVAEFYAWMMTGAITDNGVPERVGHVNVTYTNNTVSDSIKVGPYASGVERIKVNGTQPFQIDINPAGGKWKITIIYVYEDGSRSQAFNTPYTISGTRAPWPVNPGEHGKKLVEIIVIKTLIQTGAPVSVNMTVSPITYLVPSGARMINPEFSYDWAVPPLFGNYTDPADGLWSDWWLWNYTDDRFDYILEINVDDFQVESFFDVIVTLNRVSILEISNISKDTPVFAEIDPSIDFGIYAIGIRQGTWNSSGNGSIILHASPRDGTSIQNPLWHTYGEVEYLGLPIPYTRAGDGALYVNISISSGFYYIIEFNATAPVIANIWNGLTWVPFVYSVVDDAYQVEMLAQTEFLCVQILPQSGESSIEYMWSMLSPV